MTTSTIGRRSGPARRLLAAAFGIVAALSASGSALGAGGERVATAWNGPIALVNGTLIDATGRLPVGNATVLISGGRIVAAGSAAGVIIPDDARIIDVRGGTILPGFINTHVHQGLWPQNLKAWASAGVTTVRDAGSSRDAVAGLVQLRQELEKDPRNARLVSAGTMIGVYGGYGSLPVVGTEQARWAVRTQAAAGVDAIKVSLEDGYGGMRYPAKLAPEDLAAIIEAAHSLGLPVSGHLTQGAYLEPMIDAGADDIAHLPCDHMPAEAVRKLADRRVYVIPALSFSRNVGFPMARCLDNLRWLLEAGGRVALGNDYAGDMGAYDMGMPMYEIRAMSWAGMSPMRIIVAATANASVVVGLGDEIGTIEPGKAADILVVGGDPLLNLRALEDVKLVLHAGSVIRDELTQR